MELELEKGNVDPNLAPFRPCLNVFNPGQSQLNGIKVFSLPFFK